MAGEFTAGDVIVPVSPSAKGFIAELRKEVLGGAYKVGQEIGKDIDRGIKDALKGVYEPLKEETKKQRPQSQKDGDQVGGAFAQGFKRQVQAAMKTLPKAEINADSSDAQREIASVRSQLATLADKTVGVDVSSEQALGELRILQMRLDELSEGADVDVRADTAAASAQLDQVLRKVREIRGTETVTVDADTAAAQAQLSGVKAQADALDNDDVGIDVHVTAHQATAGLLALGVAAAGVTAIPVGAVLGAGLISLLGPLSAATAGFGALAAVAIPSITRIGEVLQAQEQAQKAASVATQSAGQSAAQAAIQQMQLAQASRAVGQAQEQAAIQRANAVLRVQDAERSLADAQRAATSAQEELTRARAQARRELQSLQLQISGAMLDEEQAALAVTQAQERLADARRNAVDGIDERTGATLSATVSESEVKAAELAVKQAEQAHKEQTARRKDLQRQQKEAAKNGVEGADVVVRARERLAQATRRVEDQERNLARARADVTRADREGARAVEQARQQLRMMQLQQEASAAAASAGSAASVAYADALAELSPAARDLMRDWLSLTAAFDEWQRALEPTVLPVFGGMLRMVEANLDSLTPIVYGASAAVGQLLVDMERALSGEWWGDFGERFASSVGPSTLSLGRSLGNVGTGFAGIVNAWLPYAPEFLGYLERVTAQFAEWGKGLDGSEGLTGFMDYVRETGPIVEEFLGRLWGAVTNLTSGLALLGPLALGAFGGLLWVIQQLPPEVLAGLALSIGLVVAGVKAWQIAQLALNAAMAANPIGVVLLLLAALAGVVVWAYNSFEGFREVVDSAFAGVKQVFQDMWDGGLKQGFEQIVTTIRDQIMPAVLEMWQNVFQPAFSAIGKVVSWVFTKVLVPLFQLYVAYVANVVVPVVLWLWRNVIDPAFRAIGAVVMWVWNTLLKPAFTAIVNNFRTYIAPAAIWLWKKVLQPAWKGISLAVQIAWGMIKIVFAAIKWVIQRTLGPIFMWLWKNVIKPVWAGIKISVQTVWAFLRDKVFAPMRDGTGKLGEAFQTARRVIKTAWEGIKAAAKAPVKFLVDTVYNKGVRPMWNKVAGIVGADELPKVDLPRGFARGGVLPGYSTWRQGDDQLVPMRRGEGVAISEAMKVPALRGELLRWNSIGLSGGVSALRSYAGRRQEGFARGGIFGGDTSGISMPDIPELLLDLATKSASAFAGTGSWESALNVVVNPVRRALSGIGTRGLQGIPYMATGTIRDKLVEWLDGNAIGGGGGADVGSAKGMPGRVIALARAAVGQYPESGGNNTNAITRWFGMNAQPWCAMFISWLFAQANASGSLKRAKRTAWTGDYYTSGMQRVNTRMPGDVLVYGRRHVNLSLGGRRTIGGNESNNVRHSTAYPGAPAIFRPAWAPASRGYARGGVVGRDMLTRSMLKKIGSQDEKVSFMRGYASGTTGARRGLAWVGEQGPELVDFRGGEQVYPHETSKVLAGVLGLSADDGYAAGTVPSYRGVGRVDRMLRDADTVSRGYRSEGRTTVVNVTPPPATVGQLVDGVAKGVRRADRAGKYRRW
ncbi:hypothetical protein NGM33_28650 [Nocardiopsis dassonvillei]|uniref:hypothetical protein n=1 Tax=Nocardiopsis dassonvillei TaxID=2014 RepID=UPI0020A5AC56|nr:hypothetical protein [Nocardiopsis dassonvillei]MCP3017307.1 hypothetical protein [Nocardiopsis dassonvillei]